MKRVVFLLSVSLISTLNCLAQYGDREAPVPELSVGIKSTIGRIEYGKQYFEENGRAGLGIEPTLRFDYPIRLPSGQQDFYIALTASAGLWYIPVKKQVVSITNPDTGVTSDYSTQSPLYVPFYAGFYSAGSFGLGIEVFYAKGLNKVVDLWGAKVVGLSVNRPKFRIDAGYEIYLQARQKKDPGAFASLAFLWKFKRKSDY
jgi:hypothetical protein